MGSLARNAALADRLVELDAAVQQVDQLAHREFALELDDRDHGGGPGLGWLAGPGRGMGLRLLYQGRLKVRIRLDFHAVQEAETGFSGGQMADGGWGRGNPRITQFTLIEADVMTCGMGPQCLCCRVRVVHPDQVFQIPKTGFCRCRVKLTNSRDPLGPGTRRRACLGEESRRQERKAKEVE